MIGAGAVRSAMRPPLRSAERMLFPPACVGCTRRVTQAGTLCAACWSGLLFFEPPWCEIMGTPFSHEMGPGFLSADALLRPPPFRRARAALAYSGIAKQMTQRLKYGDRTELAPTMARWMARAGHELVADAELIVPVPLHWRRLLARRFNQSAELARGIVKLSGARFAPGCVKRHRHTRQQVGLGLGERNRNVRGAFQVTAGGRRLVAGRNVLIVDDVYTTGATVRALTHALIAAEARNVDVLTFARVIPGDFQHAEPALI